VVEAVSDRSEMEAARTAGLRARHETREARAIRKAGYEEGQTAGREALARLENEFRILSDPSYAHETGAVAWRQAYEHAHECVLQEQQLMEGRDLMGHPLPAREIGTKETGT